MSALPAKEHRLRCLIARALEVLEVDLSGLAVLTEAATGYFGLTPLIAAQAGANPVLTLTRDSRWGRADEVVAQTLEMARRWGLEDRIQVLAGRDDPRIARADIVTNLGFVRPLDEPLLARLKPTAAIPLMWETWEYRREDLDLEGCRRRGIPVLGTNEHHPALRTFEYVGLLAIKLLLQAGIEVLGARVAVLGGGEFAERTRQALVSLGASVTALPLDEFDAAGALGCLGQADALVVVEHHDRRLLIGEGGLLTASAISEVNAGLTVAHVCGGVDRQALETCRIAHTPAQLAEAGRMSVTTADLGPRPLIDLHAAGLKVGAHLARARLRGLCAADAERQTLDETPLAQRFPSAPARAISPPGRSPPP